MAYLGPKSTLERSHPLAHARQPARPAEPRTAAERVAEYVRIELSLWRDGPVSAADFEARRNSCVTCPRRKDSDDVIGHCASCGCGTRERARLSNKLHMPEFRCPRGRFSTAAGQGKLALLRLPGGVRRQVWSIIKGVGKEFRRPDRFGTRTI